MTRRLLGAARLCVLPAAMAAQPVFRRPDILPAEECAARRLMGQARLSEAALRLPR